MDDFDWNVSMKISYLDQLIKLATCDCLNAYEKAAIFERVEVLCNSIEKELGLQEAPQGSEK
ncbi:hypothetical protein [Paenibacillus sp. FSL W8-0194]|uniref:hypothetical protein n=1 Tax=Paenibacillus sp. FSL W8-0194 TaxID=2921711 RepID=UPI0030DA3FE9